MEPTDGTGEAEPPLVRGGGVGVGAPPPKNPSLLLSPVSCPPPVLLLSSRGFFSN